MTRIYDVIVVGGGPTGLSLAAMLAQRGVSVVCLDRDQPAKQLQPHFDGRTTALAAAAKASLDAAGVWAHLAAKACPINDIRVTDQGSARFLHFDHQEVGEPFGWIIENRFLRHALYQRVAALPLITHLTGAEVVAMDADETTAQITYKTGKAGKNKTIAGRLIVGADGKQSFCRQAAGIAWQGREYWQSALVCTVTHTLPHHNIAIEDFLPGGPIASLPMLAGKGRDATHRSSIVWSDFRATATLMQSMPEGDFCALMERHLAPLLGRIVLEGARFVYPLGIYHAARYTAPRLVLVGEAAHAMHPIAGQGFNLSMRDNLCLAEQVAWAQGLGLDCGSHAVLARYARARRPDNLMMLAATDGLDRFFSNPMPGLSLLRQTGLAAVNAVPPLKRFFMRAAMGQLAVGR